MPFNQDGKYQHWLKISPENIEEKNTNYHEASPKGEQKLKVEFQSDDTGKMLAEEQPWEAKGDGSFGEEVGLHSGDGSGRTPFSKKKGDASDGGVVRNPNLHGRGRSGPTHGGQ